MTLKTLIGREFRDFDHKQYVHIILLKNLRVPKFEMHTYDLRPDTKNKSTINHRNCLKKIHDRLCYTQYLHIPRAFELASTQIEEDMRGFV